MNSEWKEIIAQEMEREAEEIMEEVNSDPAMQDVQAPPGMYDEIMKMIYEHEKEKVYEQLSEEDREFLRIGKACMKRRKLNRYIILVAAMVFVLAFGTISIGERKNIFDAMSSIFWGQERVVINSEDTEIIKFIKEEEVFSELETKYGMSPIKLKYLPKNTVFYEAMYSADVQGVNMIYEMEDGRTIKYIIRPNYRESSFGTVVEDQKLQEYIMVVKEVEIRLIEYSVPDTLENRWLIIFEYQDVQYMMSITDMKQNEVEKIVNNLGF